MFLAHVVATTPEGIIGVNNDLPWGYIREDMRFFSQLTQNRVLLMGYNTVKSLPKPLKNRYVIMDFNPSKGIDVEYHDDAWYDLVETKGYDRAMADVPDHYRKDMLLVAGGGKMYRDTIEDTRLVFRNVIIPKTPLSIKEDAKVVTYPLDILKRDFICVKSDVLISDDTNLILTEMWVRACP